MKKWSVLLFAIWLIVTGVVVIFDLSFNGMETILPILGIVAGVLLLLAGKALKNFHPIAILLIGIWLIVSGAVVIFDLSFKGLPIILGILAIAAGVFIFIGANKKKIQNWLAELLLTLYFIFTGLIAVLDFSFDGLPIVMGCLAAVAGILLLIKK